MKRGGYIKRNVRPRARSKTKHKPSVLRPNKFIRLPYEKWQALRVEKYEDQNGMCAELSCQRFMRLEDMHLHHNVFRSHGGLDTKENTDGLCNRCHDRRHGKGEVTAE